MKNKYELNKDYATIYVKGYGKEHKVFVDYEDFKKVNSFEGTWYARYNKSNRSLYCVIFPSRRKNSSAILMARVIIDTPSHLQIDHINRNTLDNRKQNLRNVTHAQNQQNKGIYNNNTTGVSGVYFNNQRNSYCANLYLDNYTYRLGNFKTKKEAEKITKRMKRIMKKILENKSEQLKKEIENICMDCHVKKGFTLNCGNCPLIKFKPKIVEVFGTEKEGVVKK